MKLLFDTNFLLDLFRFRIDLTEIYDLLPGQLELYVLNKTVNELGILSKKAKHGKFAKLALSLIKSSKVNVIDVTDDVDTAMVKLAGKDFVAATNDAKLRKKLSEKGVKTIYLRARKHLAIG